MCLQVWAPLLRFPIWAWLGAPLLRDPLQISCFCLMGSGRITSKADFHFSLSLTFYNINQRRIISHWSRTHKCSFQLRFMEQETALAKMPCFLIAFLLCCLEGGICPCPRARAKPGRWSQMDLEVTPSSVTWGFTRTAAISLTPLPVQ